MRITSCKVVRQEKNDTRKRWEIGTDSRRINKFARTHIMCQGLSLCLRKIVVIHDGFSFLTEITKSQIVYRYSIDESI